jgi:hypothetical protein
MYGDDVVMMLMVDWIDRSISQSMLRIDLMIDYTVASSDLLESSNILSYRYVISQPTNRKSTNLSTNNLQSVILYHTI